MEGYLRLGLLVTAAILVLLILFDGWNRKRQIKRYYNTADDAKITLNPDEVLGLDSRHIPIINDAALATISTDEKNPLYIDDLDQVNNELDISEEDNDQEEPFIPENLKIQQPISKTKKIDLGEDLIVINVLSKRGQVFSSYNLLQTLLGCGFQFGEMNIFHYYSPAALGREKLFSLASATEPGEFNLDKIGEFSCRGLILFTRLSLVSDPMLAFNFMHKTAEQLAEELGGELYAAARMPLTTDTLQKFRQKVSQYQVQTER